MSDDQKTALETRREELEAIAVTENEKRTGKGLRLKVGSTRGKNPQAVSFEVFEESLPETLPDTLTEFMELSKIEDEPTLVSFLIAGYNSASYTSASDPIAEYLDAEWDDEVRKQFRAIVRNYAGMMNVSIDEAVALLKPGIVAGLKK